MRCARDEPPFRVDGSWAASHKASENRLCFTWPKKGSTVVPVLAYKAGPTRESKRCSTAVAGLPPAAGTLVKTL